MPDIGTQRYRTPDWFGLKDEWVQTAPGEHTHLHRSGFGAPVVLLHGSGNGVSAASNWWSTIAALADDFDVVAPDLIGYGATIPATDAEYGIREWGAHVIRLIDALGLDKVWLVGNSLGGWIALQLAADHPDRVLGVVSMGTGGASRSAALSSHGTPDVSRDGIRRALEGFVVNPAVVTSAMVDARIEIGEFEVRTGRLERVFAARERDRDVLPLTAATLSGLVAPVLLVHGLQDRIIPPQRTVELASQIRYVDAMLLGDCGHWSQLERHAEFTGAVRRFLRGR